MAKRSAVGAVAGVSLPVGSLLMLVALFCSPAPFAGSTAAVIRGPYLQQGTSTTITVRWRSDLQAESVVRFGTEQGNLTASTSDLILKSEHEIELTGLTPDTTYFYSVGTTSEVLAGDDATHFFVTAPATGSSRPTRIWILGDSGTGNASAIAVRDAYESFTGATHTNLLLMLGDNAYPDGTDSEYQAKLFDIYPEMLRKTVLWPAIGNHDSVSSLPSTQTGPYFDMFTLPAGGEAGGFGSGTEAYYSFDHGNIHFVVLDSEGSSPFLGQPMMNWLEADLAATTQEWIIAYWHHPPYSKGNHDSDNLNETDYKLVQMRDNAVRVLDDWGVDLTLTGHSHSYERSFLIEGHYGLSDSFLESMKVDGGSGREGTGEDGPYLKPEDDPEPHAHSGIVHTVAGSAGSSTPITELHPAMYVAHSLLGSVVLDVDGNRLDATFLTDSGAVEDFYTIIKGCVSGDNDDDGVCNDLDNCIDTPNPLQQNSDGDAAGDLCDPCPEDPDDDIDLDGFCADADSCPTTWNPDQLDWDGDGMGDACDPDDDNDGVDDPQDCAALLSSVASSPSEIGPTLRLSKAGGTTLTWSRAHQGHTTNVYRGSSPTALSCLISETPWTARQDTQSPLPGEIFYYLVAARNLCGDGPVGPGSGGSSRAGVPSCTTLSADFDSDGAPDLEDNCPLDYEPGQWDSDLDFVGDACDLCGADPDNDIDGDGVCGNLDNCPTLANPGQVDGDADAIGDLCDNCPEAFNPAQEDLCTLELEQVSHVTSPVLRPGAPFELQVELRNDAISDSAAVSGTLSTTHPLVSIPQPIAAWPAILAGQQAFSAPPHFTVELDPAFSCGDAISFDLALSTEHAADGASFVLNTGASAGFGTFYSDDMESGTGGWTSEAPLGSNFWIQTTAGSVSPVTSWHVEEVASPSEAVLLSQTLFDPPADATLRFTHAMNSENMFDGGVLEYTTDLVSWIDAGPRITANGYNSTLADGFENPLSGRNGWSGNLGGWQTVVVDLSGLSSPYLRLRWRFGTDLYTGGPGWWIDDVIVEGTDTRCTTAGP